MVKSYRLPRRDEIIIHGLRIGHTYLTHGHLLKKESAPECCSCHVQLTVEHILLNCGTLKVIRDKYFCVTSLSELFNRVSPHSILSFIKELGFNRKILYTNVCSYGFSIHISQNYCIHSFLLLDITVMSITLLLILCCMSYYVTFFIFDIYCF